MRTLIISILVFVGGFAQSQSFELKNGDLLFQDLDCGPFCDAIEKVTAGVRGANFSHVGIAVEEEGSWKVLEAGSNGVVITSLSDFLDRSKDVDSNPKVMVGRVKLGKNQIKAALEIAYSKLGSNYDDIFDINNDSYYCSELVYYSFLQDNKPIFKLFPMTFKDPDTDLTFPAWVDYYKSLNANIPEGEPGLNPGGISRSDYVEIVHSYGKPDGINIR